MAFSDISRDTVLIFGSVDALVSVAYVAYVLIQLRNCCVWVIVLPILHLWIWIFALGCSNIRLDCRGLVYIFIGVLSVSFFIDLIVTVVEVFVFKADMSWQIVVLFAFSLVFCLLSLAQAIVATMLANALETEIEIRKKNGEPPLTKKSKPMRGLVAVWISWDVLWFIFFWVVTAITLRSCCWWIILFAIPHVWLWLFALCSADSRAEYPWIFYLYIAVSVAATFLDLSAFIISVFWFSDEGDILFVVWSVFFSVFLIFDVGNLLFSTNQAFAVKDELSVTVKRSYSSPNSNSTDYQQQHTDLYRRRQSVNSDTMQKKSI